jgi:hypothetical protein
MARGRHRYIPTRRLVIPLGIGGCAVLSAGAALLTADSPGIVPSLLVAVTAGAAVAGAVLMRRRDVAAEHRVSRERAAKSAIAWQAEKQRTELEETQSRVTELELKLTGKRADLNRLRGEHAELLRRYALAENGRATALEGRRQLALGAAEPTRALASGPADHRTAAGKPTRLTYLQADEALRNLARNAARQRHTAAPPAPPPPRSIPAPAAPRTGGFDFFGADKSEHPAPSAGPPGSAPRAAAPEAALRRA